MARRRRLCRARGHGAAYDPQWPEEFGGLAVRIRAILGPVAEHIDHIGSTAVPGLAAKDCIDIQIRVARLDDELIVPSFARRNLLFRDFLRDNQPARHAWRTFKQRLAQSVTDLADYGQVKQAPTEILMIAAEDWAQRTRWTPTAAPVHVDLGY